MNAFITPFSGPAARPTTHSHSLTSTRNRPTPFFASSAFGTPLPTRATIPTPFTPTPATSRTTPRMEVTIVVGENEPVESAIRRFKKDVSRSGHLFELRRRRYFETNTEKRIRKAAAARRKARMARNEKRKNSNSRSRTQQNKNVASPASPESSPAIASASAPMVAVSAPAPATAASAPQ